LFTNLININKLESCDEANTDEELINEEVKKAKFKLLRPLSKAYNIVVYIRSLGGYTDHFRKLARRIILIDNRIRWNS